ncbi:hypothetical protein EOM39_01990 [Candidatus Gracilibacteria bacterium]|nr:hypothetical protein [Candidatus Gracilibacteria bacterium]
MNIKINKNIKNIFSVFSHNNRFARVLRTSTSVLPISKQRYGKCNNCGACCMLPKRCKFLEVSMQGKFYCRIYKLRPLNCRKYPRTDFEFITKDICTFKFKD